MQNNEANPTMVPFSFVNASVVGAEPKLNDICVFCNASIAAISSAVMPGTSRKLGNGLATDTNVWESPPPPYLSSLQKKKEE
jgi:hypothetical protein